MSELIINNLHVSTREGQKILHGLSLIIRNSERHVVMGPNGSGKSTLASVLMGHPGYIVTRGAITLDGKDITNLLPNERAQLGLFLGFQHPTEVAGVNFSSFLRLSASQISGQKLSPAVFRRKLIAQAKALGFSSELTRRSLNQGFSGGEKKKAEILQLAMLRPRFAVLDEPDSGLDVDALRRIGEVINDIDHPLALLLITHHQSILAHVKPDFVHIVKAGRIIQSGDASLATSVEQSGYEELE